MSKHLINISDLNKKDVDEIIDLSLNIENNISSIDLQRKKIGLIFEKPSTRTRLSFLTGIHELNGLPIELDVKNLNLSRNESFVDTIKMFNLYLDFLQNIIFLFILLLILNLNFPSTIISKKSIFFRSIFSNRILRSLLGS